MAKCSSRCSPDQPTASLPDGVRLSGGPRLRKRLRLCSVLPSQANTSAIHRAARHPWRAVSSPANSHALAQTHALMPPRTAHGRRREHHQARLPPRGSGQSLSDAFYNTQGGGETLIASPARLFGALSFTDARSAASCQVPLVEGADFEQFLSRVRRRCQHGSNWPGSQQPTRPPTAPEARSV